MSLAPSVEALAALATALERTKRRWYVFGAQAVLAYGTPRLTSDIDVLIDPGRARAPKIVGELGASGFALRFELSKTALATARLLPLIHTETETPVDAVLASSGLHDEFLDRARRLDLGGVAVPVVSPEDLVAQKVLAGRRKDLDDVRGILARQRTLDLGRVREVLAAIEEATGDSRLLRRLARLVR